MRIVIRPVVDPQREVDLTSRLISAIADELARLYGGNEQLNWLEAEQHLKRIVDEARATAAETEVLYLPPAARAIGATRKETTLAACPGCPKRRAKAAGAGSAPTVREGVTGPRRSSLALIYV